MFLLPAGLASAAEGLPRIRGGVSAAHIVQHGLLRSSPHTRGCFYSSSFLITSSQVFPAYAGVFPGKYNPTETVGSLPRIRGGVSGCIAFTSYSSRVFPAYAGVFLKIDNVLGVSESLPRIRGGVSIFSYSDTGKQKSSPHTRGCFLHRQARDPHLRVFPAYAGVFLHTRRGRLEAQGLPRIRGGVSTVHHMRSDAV